MNLDMCECVADVWRRRHDGGGRAETIYDFKMMRMTLIAYFGYLSLCHSV